MGLPTEHSLNSLCINLTNRCDTYCQYCYQNSSFKYKDHIRLIDIKRVLDYFDEKGAGKLDKKYLQFTGGEITLHPEFFEIIELALLYGYYLRLQSNAINFSKMPEKRLEKLSHSRIVIKVSLDGWNAQTHEYFRAKGSFEKTVRGIEKIKKFNENIGIKTVIHVGNFSGIHKMFEICKTLDVKSFSYNIMRKIGRATTITKKTFNELDVVKALVPYFNLRENKHLLYGNSVLLYYFSPTPEISREGIFFIDHRGNIFPNQSFRKDERIGTIFGKNLDAEFDCSKLKKRIIHVDRVVFKYVKENLKI